MKEIRDEGTTLCDAETDSEARTYDTATLVVTSPSTTSTMSTCDAERDSHARRNSNAGGGIANFQSTTDSRAQMGRGKAEVT